MIPWLSRYHEYDSRLAKAPGTWILEGGPRYYQENTTVIQILYPLKFSKEVRSFPMELLYL